MQILLDDPAHAEPTPPPREIVLVIDHSPSMWDCDGVGTDPQLLRVDAARLFIQYLGADSVAMHRLAVLHFGGEVVPVAPLTDLSTSCGRAVATNWAKRWARLAGELAAGQGPGLGWLGEETTTEEDIRRGLMAWAEDQAAALTALTAADWLALALNDEGLARWLGDRATEAAPLWPVVPPVAETATWLVCPGAAHNTAVVERLTAALHSRLPQGIVPDGDVRQGTCGADIVAVLRTITVQLTEEGV
ncbi:MAG: hypothetical protein N2439_00415 [Anaerolineae bacterium]|nr:hypothetical protein [Anaerolineae bacterium]